MEILKNKFLVKLIATICLFITLLSFGSVSKAENAWDEIQETLEKEGMEEQVTGSVLIKPIINLLTGIGDAIMEILHSSIQEQRQAIIRLDGSTESERGLALFGAIVIGILAAAVFMAACVVTGGAIAAAAASIGVKAVFTITLAKITGAAIAGIIVGTMVYKSWIPKDIYLPAFSITAEEIFANEIHLFDINFFNPKPPKEIVRTKVVKKLPADKYYAFIQVYVKVGDKDDAFFGNNMAQFMLQGGKFIHGKDNIEDYTGYYPLIKAPDTLKGTILPIKFKDFSNLIDEGDLVNLRKLSSIINEANSYLGAAGYNKITKNTEIYRFDRVGENWKDSAFEDPKAERPDVLDGVLGKVYTARQLLFIEPQSESDPDTIQSTIIIYGLQYRLEEKEEKVEETIILQSTAEQLQKVIAEWYFILRNLAVLVLMIVLIYSGIRIVIGSTAGEKAKYKERLKDWLVALCLIFCMHYIMLFAIEIVDRITELVRSSTGLNANAAVIELTETQTKNAEKLIKSDEYDISNIGALDRKYINMENRFSRTI